MNTQLHQAGLTDAITKTAQDLFKIPEEMSGAEIDTLIALVEQGPLHDGDLPSKMGRAHLAMRNYACTIAVKGEQGYNAANYMGCEAYCKHFGASTIKEAMEIRKASRMIKEVTPVKTRITRGHYTDLECAALNGGKDTQAIWERLKQERNFEIDEAPVEGVFYHDFSICFMYPNGAAESLGR